MTIRPIGRHAIWAAALCLALQAGASHGMSAGGMHHSYDILRNGKPVGTHSLELVQRGALTEVKIASRIDVAVLGFPVYRLRYESDETWDDQGLLELRVTAVKGRDELRLAGRRDGDRFRWTTNDGRRQHAAFPLYPTNHWNADVLAQRQVLNTLTGTVNEVAIAPLGPKQLALPNARVTAEGFEYTGGLRLESWYDRGGRWLGMRFAAQDGSTIEYLCRDCSVEGD